MREWLLVSKDIEYKHKGSRNGIYPFSFTASSGQLVGIMGGSGVGKSTLMNLLSKSDVFAENKFVCHPRHHGAQGDRPKPSVSADRLPWDSSANCLRT